MSYIIALSHISDDSGYELVGGECKITLKNKEGEINEVSIPLGNLPDHVFETSFLETVKSFKESMDGIRV